jgi:uncharacterized protein (DUF2147 family)
VLTTISFCLLSLILQTAGSAATPVGRWKTIDDKTGRVKSIVRIYEEKGLLFGQVEKLLDPAAEQTCSKCSDERKDKPVAGMVVMRGLKQKGAEFSGGDILDPKNGSVYRCRMRLLDDGQKLSVRGYLGVSLFGRSQVWIRED